MTSQAKICAVSPLVLSLMAPHFCLPSYFAEEKCGCFEACGALGFGLLETKRAGVLRKPNQDGSKLGITVVLLLGFSLHDDMVNKSQT